MKLGVVQVELVPFKVDELSYTERVSIGEQNHKTIASTVSPESPGRIDQRFDFLRGQILPRTLLNVFGLCRRQCF